MRRSRFSHPELSLLIFALERGDRGAAPLDSTGCEDLCPLITPAEEHLTPEKRLVRHLSNHLREGWIECGMLELIGGDAGDLSSLEPAILLDLNRRVARWSCEVSLDQDERRLLYEAVRRLPRSAWFSIPLTLWRLRRELRC